MPLPSEPWPLMRPALLLALSALCAGCAGLPDPGIPVAPSLAARAIVFDIDGTLTPDVYEFTAVRPGAAAAVHAYARRGYKIIYLSNRVRFLQQGIPAWLQQHGFPDGSIHVAQTDADHDHPVAFKRRILQGFVRRGWWLAGAYGDSSSDFQAYAEAGISPRHVFALLRKGQTRCQPGPWRACLRHWTQDPPVMTSRPD